MGNSIGLGGVFYGERRILFVVDHVINFLLNTLSKKKFTGEMCQFTFPLPRGDVRDCKKKK